TRADRDRSLQWCERPRNPPRHPVGLSAASHTVNMSGKVIEVAAKSSPANVPSAEQRRRSRLRVTAVHINSRPPHYLRTCRRNGSLCRLRTQSGRPPALLPPALRRTSSPPTEVRQIAMKPLDLSGR